MNQENEKVIGSPLKPRGSQSFVGENVYCGLHHAVRVRKVLVVLWQWVVGTRGVSKDKMVGDCEACVSCPGPTNWDLRGAPAVSTDEQQLNIAATPADD